jgi:mRNA-degrading endonuclease RelE of RelBE toxin-antitoxin system
MAYKRNTMQIIETSIFTRRVLELLSDDDYRELQSILIIRPDAGPIIPGSGGLRKLRWAASGRGKRGGARVIYYWFASQDQLLMLYIYPKNEQDDLTSDQLKALKKIVEREYP